MRAYKHAVSLNNSLCHGFWESVHFSEKMHQEIYLGQLWTYPTFVVCWCSVRSASMLPFCCPAQAAAGLTTHQQ